MPCAIKNCKIKSNINPKTGLCTSCDQCLSGLARRMASQERQSSARDQQHALHRANTVGGAGSSDEGDGPNGSETGVLPKVDLKQLISSHSAMGSDSAAVDSSKVLKDILGVVINMYAKNDDIEKVKKN